MKKSIYFLLATFMIFLTSCEVVQSIFSAGVWVGVIIVLAVIALIIWLVVKVFK